MFKKNRLRFQNLRLNIRGAGNSNDVDGDRSYSDKNQQQQHQHEYDLSDTHDIGNVSIGSNRNNNNHGNNVLNRSDGELAAFDACIEACDALTASYSTLICNPKENSSFGTIKAHVTVKEINNKKDEGINENKPELNQGKDLKTEADENHMDNDLNASPTSVKVDDVEPKQNDVKKSKYELSECFVRVSPDGDLIFNPVPSNHQQDTISLPPSSPPSSTASLLDNESMDSNDIENKSNSNVNTEESELQNKIIDDKIQTKKQRMSQEDDPYAFAHLPLSSDFDSAIIVGDDRQLNGDLIANGFSAKGW